jgi:YesN/AraC family two-component response regulator
MKILVVDDEEDVQKLILRHFRQEIRNQEFEFCFASNGEEALSVLQSQPDISIIVTDINMPKMDGLTLLTQINALRSERQAIVVSAYDDLKNIRTAMNNGAFDFVVKPLDLQDFTLTLKKTISYIKAVSEAQTRNTELVEANPLQIILGFSSLIME